MAGGAAIDRVALVVSDLDRAERDYVDALEFTIERREPLDPDVMSLLGVRDARGRRSTLRLGDEHVDLLEFDGPAGRPYPADSTGTDLWFQHFAIAVADIVEAHERVSANDRFRPISRSGPVRLPASSGGVRAFKFRDADGHPLELLELPGSRAPAAQCAPAEQRAPGAALFLGVDHTAISVSDTGASIDFFGSVLGLGAGGRSENAGPEQEDLDDVRGAAVTVTRVASDRPAPRLELLHYHVGTRRPIPRSTMGNDIAAAHTVVHTESLDPVLVALEGRGARSTADAVLTGADGARTVRATTPDGHLFLIGERSPA